MSNALEARLTRLEAKGDQASRKFIVLANEAERDALARAGGILSVRWSLSQAFHVPNINCRSAGSAESKETRDQEYTPLKADWPKPGLGRLRIKGSLYVQLYHWGSEKCEQFGT